MKEKQSTINCTKITEQTDFFNDKIGLIIPAYNAHSTIKKLFHSIAMFDFLSKIEVCLIDDKSDYSYDYLYGLFPEINLTIIKNTHNCGPGYSRNRGIEWAIKKDLPFIMFADADDYFINFDFWSNISQSDKQNNSFFTFRFYDEKGKLFLTDADVWSFGKVYCTSIIKEQNIRFSENYSNEDVVFNFIYFNFNYSIYNSNLIIYQWVNTENSLSRTENYDYNSYSELINNLTNAFLKHKESLPKKRISLMILNRTIRLFFYFNDLLFSKPNLLNKNDKALKNQEIWQSLHNYYINCYKPYEKSFSQTDIIKNFNEIYCGNNGSSSQYLWLDYQTFIKKIKEG